MDIRAPAPAYASQIELPSRELGDQVSKIATVVVHEMEDNSLRTVIRDTGKKRRTYTIEATEAATEEAALFIATYSTDQWLVDGTLYYYESTSLEIDLARGGPIDEMASFTLTLREV